MSYKSSRPTILSYPDATRAFNDTNFILDLNEATQRYAQMQKALFTTFATISAQLHSLDLQRVAPPLRPRWNAIHTVCDNRVRQETNPDLTSGFCQSYEAPTHEHG